MQIMRVISLRRLREFWTIHPNAEAALQRWYARTTIATWQNFIEVRADFHLADMVQRLTVFNISGNNFRLIARIEFNNQKVFVRAVLTHAEYDEEKWKDDDWFEN